MGIKRDIKNKKLYIIDNEQMLLETGILGAEFIIHLYTKNKGETVTLYTYLNPTGYQLTL